MIGPANDTTFYDIFGDENVYTTSNTIQHNCSDHGENNFDVLTYTQSVEKCFVFMYIFWFIFLFVSVIYETNRQEREEEIKSIEERIQDEIYIIRSEMKKFKKNMKKVRKTNEKNYKIQRKIMELEETD